MEFPWALALCSVLLAAQGNAQEFSYEGANGPANWPRLFSRCGGRRQSPIDIRTNSTTGATYPPLRMKNPGFTPWGANLTNNGHSALVQLNPAPPVPFVLQGGPLKGPYVFQQLHFHWGSSYDAGSEHAINSRFTAMEMHMLFYKKKYGDSAANYSDGLAVVAVLFDMSEVDNPALAPIVAALPRVATAGAVTPLGASLDVGALLPSNCGAYFTYPGSLTTPPCDEAVTWILFQWDVPVSASQVAAFRTLRTEQGRPLVSNRRPVQPLGDRAVRWVRGGGSAPRCFF